MVLPRVAIRWPFHYCELPQRLTQIKIKVDGLSAVTLFVSNDMNRKTRIFLGRLSSQAPFLGIRCSDGGLYIQLCFARCESRLTLRQPNLIHFFQCVS